MADELSPAMQQYLETIYDLSHEVSSPGVADIALAMNISKAGVSQALDMLKTMGLIAHPRYGKVFLTRKGKSTAKKIRLKHDTLKYFFHSILGVDPAIAEMDACKIEHIISSESFEKLLLFLSRAQDPG
jgi:DtxR family transcriptional regulator, Mn-dependent transcriptional regulator